MKRVKLLPAMPTREKLLTSRCLDGVASSDRWCQPREGFSVGSLQPQEGCGGDAQLWARGWDRLCPELSAASVAAAETQRGSGSPREKVEGDGTMTPAGLDLCCPSCCRGMAGSVHPVPGSQGR